MTREAVLYVPDDASGPAWRTVTFRAAQQSRWVDVLADYCSARGYIVVAVCSDLATAAAMQAEKPGRKLIVGRMDWLHDTEVVTLPSTHPPVDARRRRPQRIGR